MTDNDSAPEITFESSWPTPTEAARRAAIDFWIQQNVVPGNIPLDERASQLVMLARSRGDVICVATCEVKVLDQIGEPVYYYRTLTSPSSRLHLVATEVLLRAFDLLSEYNRSRPQPEAVGIYMEIENTRLMQLQNEAIWKTTRFLYIGNTPQGWHRRIRYFNEAVLSK